MLRGVKRHMAVLQVCLYTCKDLIASVPFFEDAEEGFTTSVVTLLRPAVSKLPVLLELAAIWGCRSSMPACMPLLHNPLNQLLTLSFESHQRGKFQVLNPCAASMLERLKIMLLDLLSGVFEG